MIELKNVSKTYELGGEKNVDLSQPGRRLAV